ncbi:hypothetical protein D3C86_1618100 [compost metagenome]
MKEMELHIKQRAELAELVISVAEASSESYASSYSDIAYYAHLSGQLMGIIKGICLDLDDKGIERLKRIYLKGEEE